MFLRLLCRAPRISSQPPRRRPASAFRRRKGYGDWYLLWHEAFLSPVPRTPALSRRRKAPITGRFHPPIRGHGDGLLAGEIRAGDRRGGLATSRGRALGHDLAAITAGRRAEIEQLIGVGDHFAVVLDHQQRVAQVAEFFQGLEQPLVVAGVQPDRRFVQHIEYAAQAAADLAARRMRWISPPERVGAGRASVRYSSPTSTRNCTRLRTSRSTSPATFRSLGFIFQLETCQQLAQRRAAEIVHRAAAEPHGGRIVAQPAAAADRAFHFVHQVLELAA